MRPKHNFEEPIIYWKVFLEKTIKTNTNSLESQRAPLRVPLLEGDPLGVPILEGALAKVPRDPELIWQWAECFFLIFLFCHVLVLVLWNWITWFLAHFIEKEDIEEKLIYKEIVKFYIRFIKNCLIEPHRRSWCKLA